MLSSLIRDATASPRLVYAIRGRVGGPPPRLLLSPHCDEVVGGGGQVHGVVRTLVVVTDVKFLGEISTTAEQLARDALLEHMKWESDRGVAEAYSKGQEAA